MQPKLLSDKDVGVLTKAVIKNNTETRKESPGRFSWLTGFARVLVGSLRGKHSRKPPQLTPATLQFLHECADPITMKMLGKMKQSDPDGVFRVSHLTDLLTTHFGAEEELRKLRATSNGNQESANEGDSINQPGNRHNVG